MPKRNPVAFISYVHHDDAHDFGRITQIRVRLEGEVLVHLGRPFPIFQDRNDISWGEKWEERISSSLLDVTFLIPVITPSFFNSAACRSELLAFAKKESEYGFSGLIMPLWYLNCPQLESSFPAGTDEIVDIIRAHQWVDWRELRHEPLTSPPVLRAVTTMAEQIVRAAGRLAIELDAEAQARENNPTASLKPAVAPALSNQRPAALPARRNSIPLPPVVRKPGTRKQRIDTSQMASFPYYVYTREYDEELAAADLSNADELVRLQSFLLKDMHEFALPLPELHRPSISVTVSFLLDNSGSLRGKPIFDLARLCIFATRWLEAKGVDCEVLGYTTRAWKGGQSRERWLADGKPPSPGRLNDIRHIIYKDRSTSTDEATLSIALMLREGLLKENIDGEALIWAYNRLCSSQADQRILVALSDGAPVDDSTLASNNAHFLLDHSKHVARTIEQNGDVHLIGVGLGHRIDRVFCNSIVWDKSDWQILQLFEGLRNVIRK